MRIGKTASPAWQLRCSLPRGGRGVRSYCTAGIAEPYLALIARTSLRAISRCVNAAGGMPSQLNAKPKGEPLHRAGAFGNGANWVTTPASESSGLFTLSVKAPERAVA